MDRFAPTSFRAGTMFAPHLRACLVCQATMVGEKSEPNVPVPDVFRCLNCGAVIELLPRGT